MSTRHMKLPMVSDVLDMTSYEDHQNNVSNQVAACQRRPEIVQPSHQPLLITRKVRMRCTDASPSWASNLTDPSWACNKQMGTCQGSEARFGILHGPELTLPSLKVDRNRGTEIARLQLMPRSKKQKPRKPGGNPQRHSSLASLFTLSS